MDFKTEYFILVYKECRKGVDDQEVYPPQSILVSEITIVFLFFKDPWPEDDDFGMEMIHDAREDAIRKCQENCKREVSRKHGSNWAVFYYSQKCRCDSGSTDSDPRSFNQDTVFVHGDFYSLSIIFTSCLLFKGTYALHALNL